MLNFIKCYFWVSIEMNILFFSSIVLIWWITLIDSWILNHPCITGISLNWLWYITRFVCCRIWFMSLTALLLFFSLTSLLGFGIRVMLLHNVSWEVIPFLWKSLCKIDIICFLNIWQNSRVTPSNPRISFRGIILIIKSIDLMVNNTIQLVISSRLNFG